MWIKHLWQKVTPNNFNWYNTHVAGRKPVSILVHSHVSHSEILLMVVKRIFRCLKIFNINKKERYTILKHVLRGSILHSVNYVQSTTINVIVGWFLLSQNGFEEKLLSYQISVVVYTSTIFVLSEQKYKVSENGNTLRCVQYSSKCI